MAVKKKSTAKRGPVANGRPKNVITRNPKRKAKPNTSIAAGVKTKTRYVTKNPGLTGKLALAVGTAFVIRTFDGVVAKFVPALSAPIMVFGKAAAGWALGRYTKRWLGSWAEILEWGLYVSAALTAWDAWVAPIVNPYLGAGVAMAPEVTKAETITATTGQLGRRLYLNDGNVLDVFPDQQPAAYVN